MEGTIRLARPADAKAVTAIYAPFVRDTHVSFETAVPTEDEIGRRIRAALELAPWLVHDLDGEVDAYAYAGPYRDRAAYRWSVETSVYVREDRRRRGVARLLMTTLLDALARQGFRTAVAIIALPNAASVILFESLGFRPAGILPAAGFKVGGWWDVGTWARPLATGADLPARTRSLAEIGMTEGWRA
jgi:phosphinothricin acetyltransferase